jgi:hypothetical protein
VEDVEVVAVVEGDVEGVGGVEDVEVAEVAESPESGAGAIRLRYWVIRSDIWGRSKDPVYVRAKEAQAASFVWRRLRTGIAPHRFSS